MAIEISPNALESLKKDPTNFILVESDVINIFFC